MILIGNREEEAEDSKFRMFYFVHIIRTENRRFCQYVPIIFAVG